MSYPVPLPGTFPPFRFPLPASRFPLPASRLDTWKDNPHASPQPMPHTRRAPSNNPGNNRPLPQNLWDAIERFG